MVSECSRSEVGVESVSLDEEEEDSKSLVAEFDISIVKHEAMEKNLNLGVGGGIIELELCVNDIYDYL